MKKWIVILLVLALCGIGVWMYVQKQAAKPAVLLGVNRSTLPAQSISLPIPANIISQQGTAVLEENFEDDAFRELDELLKKIEEEERLWREQQELDGKLERTESNTVTVNVTSTPNDTELLPTLDSPSTAKNRVWVGTFQLVWNDLMDELVKGPVSIQEPMAKLLNQKAFTTTQLSESAYYKKWGKASPKLRQEIEQGIKEKFNETSDVLQMVDWNQPVGGLRYILYAMLKKDFSFVEPFDKLEDGLFGGSSGPVKYFGINGDTHYRVRNSVHVLFYNDYTDFAVRLTSKQGDEVYLYHTSADKTLDRLYADMLAKDTHTNDSIQEQDYFKVPMLDFKLLREFTELAQKEFPIYNKEIGEWGKIEKAIETAQFKMDETGVRLKSEAAMQVESFGVSDENPRYFYLDSSYAIFINEKGKKPYFAMRVTDAKALQ